MTTNTQQTGNKYEKNTNDTYPLRTDSCRPGCRHLRLPGHVANPADSNEALQIKTTKENATQLDATAELETFCKGQDALAGIGAGQATGCKTVVPLHNTCIAVAYPKAMGKLTAQNVVAITSPRFKTVHQIALNQCIKKYGSQGQCALETVYCTSETYYQGTVKTLWEKIKSI